MRVFFLMERSKRDWNGPRNVLRPLPEKLVSYVSQTCDPFTVAQAGTPRVLG